MESRTLLSGNVMATQQGPVLSLLGDELGNGLRILSGRAPDQIIVEGMNNTRINGTHEKWVFEGVRQMTAPLAGGNDSFETANLTFAALDFVATLHVDGGAGDDRIVMKNTTILGGYNVSVTLVGEISYAYMEPTTGNDTIELANTRIVNDPDFGSDAAVTILGEENYGGVITGGNDRITVSNTTIESIGQTAFLSVIGDLNVANDSTGNATIGGGNDRILVTDTVITNTGPQGNKSLAIVGDDNAAYSFGGEAIARIGGGNDTITVRNTTIAGIDTESFNNSQLFIRGDTNYASFVNFYGTASGSSTATIGGGNDSITVDEVTISATGTSYNNNFAGIVIEGDLNIAQNDDPPENLTGTATATLTGDDSILVNDVRVITSGASLNEASFDDSRLSIKGDVQEQFGAAAGIRGRILGGNDFISLTNTTVGAVGSGPDVSRVEIYGEYGTSASGSPLSDRGHDWVRIENVTVEGGAAEVYIDMGDGDDLLGVANCSFGVFSAFVGGGNDLAIFVGNTFQSAHLDGGPGVDVLFAQGNDGVLTHSNFERWRVG